MLIIGAKGFAKEVLDVVTSLETSKNITFYDDINSDSTKLLFGKYAILKSDYEVINRFLNYDNRFTLGIGNPLLRKRMYDKFNALGGYLTSTISSKANIGNHEVLINDGNNIFAGVSIANSVKTGIGCIVYYNVIITHDVIIGDFVELSPAAVLLGRCRVGNYSQIGANATILPDISIGTNVTVGAGSVVTKDVPDNSVVMGVPAQIKKVKETFNF